METLNTSIQQPKTQNEDLLKEWLALRIFVNTILEEDAIAEKIKLLDMLKEYFKNLDWGPF